MGDVADIGFGALEPGGAGLILGPRDLPNDAGTAGSAAGARMDRGLDARQCPRHRRSSLGWSAPGKLVSRKCESYLVF